MARYSRTVFVPAPLEEVFSYCTSVEGFRQQFPFAVKWLAGPHSWKCNDILDFRYRLAGLWVVHRAEIIEFKRNEYFTDRMTHGLYRQFRHTHRFTPAPGGTMMHDEIEFTFGLGALIDRCVGTPTLDNTFKKRHQALVAHFSKREPA
jgi:ligand-binding SRPBCC domain-containing protein